MRAASPRPLPPTAARPHAGHRLRRLAICIGLGLVSATAAQAQSLQEVFEAAHAYDATYLAAKALDDSAVYRAAQADALMRPNVLASASAGYNDTRPVIGSNYSGVQTGVTLNAKQPLFNPANVASIEQAQRQLIASHADLESAEQDLIIRVAQAYFDVLGAQDTLATTRTSKAAISEQLASAKRNFEVGTATITDTREAQARYDLATAQEIAAENDLVTKRIALDQLVGRQNVVPRQLAVPVALPAIPGAIDDWVGRAESGHPLVRKAQLGLEVARLEIDKARAGNLPTVDAVASLSGQHGNTQGFTGTSKFGSVGLQLNYTIFAGYQIQNRIKETLVLEDKARNDFDVARRGVTQATRQAYYGVQSGAAQVKALEAAESSSQLALEATQLGYRVGVRVNLDVLNAQTQLFTTQRDLARARYDVLVGSLKLRQAAGQLNSGDVAAVNQLLAK
ncbi:TolC family outer membrane protein [soil metagenome]